MLAGMGTMQRQIMASDRQQPDLCEPGVRIDDQVLGSFQTVSYLANATEQIDPAKQPLDCSSGSTISDFFEAYSGVSAKQLGHLCSADKQNLGARKVALHPLDDHAGDRNIGAQRYARENDDALDGSG